MNSNWLIRTSWLIATVGLAVLLLWYFAIRTPIPQRPLRIGFEPNPPVQVRTSSGYAGLAVETVSEAARRAHLTLQWVETGTSSDEAFQRGLVDLWPIMADLPYRRERVHFTRPWLHTQHTLILRSDSPVPNRDFDGRIAIFKLPLHLRLARSEFPNAQMVEFDESRDIVREVCGGRVFAGFLEDRAALRALLDKPAECASVGLQLHGLPALTVAIGTASTFEAATAADKLREEIDSQFEDGTLAATVAKYSFYGLDDTWTTYDLMRRAERARLFAWGIGVLGIALTVTIWLATSLRQRKRSEAVLRRSEGLFRAIFHQAAVGVAQVTLEGAVTMVNDRYCEVLGYAREELVGKGLLEIIHPKDGSAVLANRQRLLKGETPSYAIEMRSVRNDGSIAWLKWCESLVDHAADPEKCSITVVEDITLAKQSEAALQESEARFRNLADTAPVMIWVSGLDRLCTFFNSGWLNFTGSTLEEALGLGWSLKVHPDDREACIANYSSAFEARRIYHQECRLHRADGEYRWVLAIGAPRYEGNKEFAGYVGACTDITELKRSQQEAFAMQKMETIGALAGGIAHDFNNLLGGILALAELSAAELEEGKMPREGIENIRAVASRGAEIVRELMIYSGQDKTEDSVEPLDQVDLSGLVEEMLGLLKITISKRAVLKSDLDRNLPPMPGKASRIRQIVMNLVINASEALGQKDGVIRVRTSRSTLSHGSAATGPQNLAAGDYLILEVSDTGCGMSEEVQGKAFDPFFTTKFAGRGLGLAVVHGIVRDHGGAVNLISTPSEGTTFEVFLPSVSETSRLVEGATAQSPKKEDRPESRTVLVVEDEETLRLAVSKMLRKRGFAVVEAVDGNSAVESIRSYGDAIDVMLLDMTLPGISSPEVLAEARRLRPNLKPILTSAHSQEAIHASYAGLPREPFLRKPYRIDELVSLLREPS